MGTYYGYSRVSTEEQSDYSLQNQLKYLEVQSQSLNMEFSAYKEKVSGKNSNRPQLTKVLSLLEEGDVLGVYDNSRLGRDTSENLKLAQQISSKGARLHINGSFVDLENPNHELMLTIESAVSTYQRKNQNLKSRIGIETKKENGEWIFTTGLLGYDVIFKGSQPVVSINEKEAEIIRFIFSEYQRRKSIKKITDEINRLGWRTRSGKPFNVATIRRYILKPIYMGYYLLTGAGKRKGQEKVKVEPSNLVKSKYYPPIISEEDWWDVYNSYRGVRRKHARQFEYRWSYYPLSGIMRCGYCGSGFVHSWQKYPNGTTVGYYNNRTHKKDCETKEVGTAFYSAKSEILEPLFENVFYSIFMWDKEVYAYLEEQSQYIKEKVSDVDNQIQEVEKSIQDRKTKIDNLYSAIEQGLDFERTISRIQSLEKEITEFEDSKKHLKSSVISEEQALEDYRNSFTEDLLKEFILGTNEQRRAIYKRFFSEVKVMNWGIYIQLVYPITYKIRPIKKQGKGNIQGDFEIKVLRDGDKEEGRFFYEHNEWFKGKTKWFHNDRAKRIWIDTLEEYEEVKDRDPEEYIEQVQSLNVDEETKDNMIDGFKEILRKGKDHEYRYRRLEEIYTKVNELKAIKNPKE